MAFGKKKGDEAAPGAAAGAEAEDDSLSLFPDTDDDEPSAEASAPALEAVADPPSVEPTPAAAAPSADALLSVFQASDGADSDRSVLLDMAGDVELADLLEELSTLSMAIGIARA